MRGNEITELVPDTFKETDVHITRLDLSSNQLTRVNFSMFDSFIQLQVLKKIIPKLLDWLIIVLKIGS